MPATRTKRSTPGRPTKQRKGPPEEVESSLEAKIGILRESRAWPDIVSILETQADLPGASIALQEAYCRAFFHTLEPSEATITTAKATLIVTLQSTPNSVDALLCAGKLAQIAGDAKGVSDKALEAYKASGYKDEDALELLKSGHTQSANPTAAAKDHYQTLHVSRDAPQSVIAAAHQALSFSPGSAEAAEADEALSTLSHEQRRAEYDNILTHRKTGGGGREFSGGSEILKQLGEALGLVFPAGFVFPPSGRFQGGFGGGFEYTWGDGKTEEHVEDATDVLLKSE